MVELTLNGTPVKDTDVFTACLSSYRASGTGGYDGYVGCLIVREIGTEMSDPPLDYATSADTVESFACAGEFRVVLTKQQICFFEAKSFGSRKTPPIALVKAWRPHYQSNRRFYAV